MYRILAANERSLCRPLLRFYATTNFTFGFLDRWCWRIVTSNVYGGGPVIDFSKSPYPHDWFSQKLKGSLDPKAWDQTPMNERHSG